MIRTFIKSIVRDLTNAVARSELASENARLRSEAARDNATALTTIADWERQCDDLRAKIRELEAANEKLSAQIQELTYDDRDDLRARLEAAEGKVADAANRAERSARVAARQALIEMSRKIRRQTSEREMEEIEAKVFTGWFEPKPKDTAERRSPVDRSAAIASVYAFLVDHWRGCNADRYAREIVDAVLTAQKEAPAEKLTTAEAVAHICRELQSDPGYRIAWVANIAMQFKDRLAKAPFILDDEASHKLANEAAEGFIELLCKDAPRPTREATNEKPDDVSVVPQEVHERGWQWRPASDDTAFAPPFGTIRQCRVCGCLVGGGPKACVRCVRAEEADEAAREAHAEKPAAIADKKGVRAAMELAAKKFSKVECGGIFNLANFSAALMEISGLRGDVDGLLCRTILADRDDVEPCVQNEKGCAHYRIKNPAAFVPAETDAEPSAELVERMARIGYESWQSARWGCHGSKWDNTFNDSRDPERAQARAIYALIARDHAAAVKRVGELEECHAVDQRKIEALNKELIPLRGQVAGLRLDVRNGNADYAGAVAEIERLKAEVTRLSAPCPADGMSALDVGKHIYVHGDLEATGAGAIKLFGRAAK